MNEMTTRDMLIAFAVGTFIWLGHLPIMWAICKIAGWL